MATKTPIDDATDLGMSSEAVENATGRGWDAWLTLLDKAGAATMKHKDIAAMLHAEHDVSGWWSQMITVGYERARGLRKVHEKTDGFSASVSRTLAAPVGEVYRAFATPAGRADWLGAPEQRFKVTTANTDKSLRIAWGESMRVEVNFYAKGPAKCQVQVQQNKLRAAGDVAKAKAFWAGAIDRLRERVEA